MLVRAEECGSTYLPQVNAIYVREFQMAHAAEVAARFLHQACQGLPHRLSGNSWPELELSKGERAMDRFYVRVIEQAIAYFGSRVLYPSRLAPTSDDTLLTRVALDKIAHGAARSEDGTFESTVLGLGQRIGNQIYEAYLAGKITPSGARRLFLAHVDEPGLARKVCGSVISKLKAASRPLARAAHA